MKKFTFLVLAALVFVGCSDDKEPIAPDVTEYEIIGFEDAKLGDVGFIWGKDQATEQDDEDYLGNPIKSNIFYGSIYTEGKANVYSYFTDYGHLQDSWNGFVISNHTDRKTEDFTNDKSVYAESGANGSKQFVVGYYGAWTPDGKGIPTIKFTSPVAVHSVAVALPTYVYYYFTNSIATVLKPTYTVVVTGTDQSKAVSVALVDGMEVKTGWMTVDLSSLGTVSELVFKIECADENAPLYFCIDDLTCEK